MTTIERARRYLEKLPPAISGAGGHDATFRAAACLVHGFALSEGEAFAVLSGWNGSHCSPPWSEAELRHKIASALAKPPEKPRGHLLGNDHPLQSHHAPPRSPAGAVPTWPALDREALRGILRDGQGLADLWHLSPDDPEGITSEDFIEALFPGNPWLCVGRDQRRAETDRREAFRDRLGELQFIVPNPMTGPEGKTQTGKPSARCLENTGPRRFLVVECDFRPEDTEGRGTVADLCGGVLLHLARFAPLVMAVHSGGKSLHGWFTCEGRSEDKLRRFMRYAVSLGADRATWTRCQFVRMPEGRRATGERQTVYFWNPTLLKP